MTKPLDKMHELVTRAALEERERSLSKRRHSNPTEPSAAWVTKARIEGELGYALSVVLATVGCSHARGPHGGCTMCSYLLDGAAEQISSSNIVKQFRKAMSRLEHKEPPLSVKIYTSGSFLDTEEIPQDARVKILDIISDDDRVQEVVIETRPEFIQLSTLEEIKTKLGERTIEIAIGLESSSDVIREVYINKGFTFQDFKTAVDLVLSVGLDIRSYVLIKPPFLTEKQALLDGIQSIKDAADLGSNTVSVNPVAVQKDTVVERLWYRRDYRPPWLWTVSEVLRRARQDVSPDVRIICDPVAPGKRRGPHNCGMCDDAFSKAISKFSLTQDAQPLATLDCDCHHSWMHSLEHEELSLLIHGR
jgi:hypothetical protein